MLISNIPILISTKNGKTNFRFFVFFLDLLFCKKYDEFPEDYQEYRYKVLVVGDSGGGKTSLIHRYVNGVFSSLYRATIGVDFASKAIKWNSKTSIRLQLWDIAGNERFGHMTRVCK